MEVSFVNSNNQLPLDYYIDNELYNIVIDRGNIDFDNISIDQNPYIEFEFDEEIRIALEKNNLFLNNE